ncbi:MAG: hypothetical protein CML22_06880 [Rheinheimera sp.]|nr:hypothetical protein [Rheinheimera sp.]MBM34007.1 hypothetical protein [Rheinheimera sp.]
MPLHAALVGQSIDVPDELKAIKESIIKAECASWLTLIKGRAEQFKGVSNSPLSEPVVKALREALASFDGRAACQAYYQHVDEVMGALRRQLMSEVKSVVDPIRHSDKIWPVLEDMALYGLCLSSPYADDDMQLTLESCDFFQHHFAAINHIPAQYQAHYALLLNELMIAGSGVWQLDVSQYYGAMECTRCENELAEVGAFVRAFSEANFTDAVALVSNNQNEVISDFLDELNEMYLYGEDLTDALESDPESVVQFINDAFERLTFEVQSVKLTSNKGVTLDDVASLSKNDSSGYAILLSQVAKGYLSYKQDNHKERSLEVMEQKEDTFPFGIIISPLSEGELNDSVDNMLQGVYEGFMNAAEDNDVLIIKTGHSDWFEVVCNHSKSTGLMMALISGMDLLAER